MLSSTITGMTKFVGNSSHLTTITHNFCWKEVGAVKQRPAQILKSGDIVHEKMIDDTGSNDVWRTKWTMSRLQVMSAGFAAVVFLVGAGLFLWLDVPESARFPTDDGGTSVKQSNVFSVIGVDKSGLQPHFSFRLSRSLLPDTALEGSTNDRCMECKTEGPNEACLDGDKIILGTLQRQASSAFYLRGD
jgi:hypothetical protein